MLVTEVSVWPGGRPDDKFGVAKLYVANISQLSDRSDYVWVYDEPNPLSRSLEKKRITRFGVIRDYDRYQPVHRLLARVLDEVEGPSKEVIESITADEHDVIKHVIDRYVS